MKNSGQKNNAKRLQRVQEIAKGLKQKNPKLKHTNAISQAWKIMKKESA